MGSAHNKMSYSVSLARGYNGPGKSGNGFTDPLQWGKPVGTDKGLIYRAATVIGDGYPKYEDFGDSVAIAFIAGINDMGR